MFGERPKDRKVGLTLRARAADEKSDVDMPEAAAAFAAVWHNALDMLGVRSVVLSRLWLLAL